MKVKLLNDSRITVKAGETVDVSPSVAAFLFSVGSAEKVEEPEPAAEPEAPEEVEGPAKPEPVKKPGRKKKG